MQSTILTKLMGAIGSFNFAFIAAARAAVFPMLSIALVAGGAGGPNSQPSIRTLMCFLI